MTRPGLTPYVTPAMLLATNYGISWSTFPKPGASVADQVAAQLDICAVVTSEIDQLANMIIRATVNVEQEFGPDFLVTLLPNGWTRFRLSARPVTQIIGAQCSPAGSTPPAWSTIPVSQIMTEHASLPETGTDVPGGAGPTPTAVLLPPGYVSWTNGRNGYLVQVTTITGFPVAGIDVAAASGDNTLHVDDITGWAGARGTIYDPPWREQVYVTAAVPDNVGAITGPGTLTISSGLQFRHAPAVGGATEADQRILLSAMPTSLIQAGYYMATHFGLIRGSTASVMQTARGAVVSSGLKGAMDWYERARQIVERMAATL